MIDIAPNFKREMTCDILALFRLIEHKWYQKNKELAPRRSRAERTAGIKSLKWNEFGTNEE